VPQIYTPLTTHKASALKVVIALMANAVSAAHVTAMAVIAASAVVSVLSAACKTLRQVSLLMQISR
jgi:hypothetical protein